MKFNPIARCNKKRCLDLALAFLALIIFFSPMVLIFLMIKMTSKEEVFYWSKRIGLDNREFMMPKFRTMKKDTPVVATDLLNKPEIYITKIGSFLRKTSLDELPQIWSVIKGDMSFVGPRPALFNQNELILFRCEHGINQLLPGITGWAQVNGRDELSIEAKVIYDAEYLQRQSLRFDLKIIGLTITRVLRSQGVSH